MPEAQSTEDKARKTALSKAYAAANKRLRDTHQTTFNQFYSEEAAKRGVEWKPRPTEQEKAQQEIATLLRLNPNLIEFIEAEVTKVKGSTSA